MLLPLPASAQSSQAQGSQAAPRLTLSAPVGTAQEYTLTTKTTLRIVDAQVSALPGSKVTEADLRAARASTPKAGTVLSDQTISGKSFQKVTARDAAGNTTLLVTTVMPTGQGQETLTISVTMRLDPQNKSSLVKIESTNPDVQRVLAQLKPDQLNKIASEGTSPLYGILLQNQPQTQQLNIDAQKLLGGLLAPLAGPGGEQLFKQIQATPLKATATTVYKGQNAAGQAAFDQTVTYQPWSVKLVGQAGMPTMQVEILSGKVNTQSAVRRDGFAAQGVAKTNVRMRLTMEMDGLRNQMTMDMVQEVVTQPK